MIWFSTSRVLLILVAKETRCGICSLLKQHICNMGGQHFSSLTQKRGYYFTAMSIFHNHLWQYFTAFNSEKSLWSVGCNHHCCKIPLVPTLLKKWMHNVATLVKREQKRARRFKPVLNCSNVLREVPWYQLGCGTKYHTSSNSWFYVD